MKRVLPFLVWVLVAFHAPAEIRVVDLGRLAADYPALGPDLDFVVAHLDALDHWSPEWKFSLEKGDAAARVQALEARVGDLVSSHGADVDLRLLDLTLLQYLYNLDAPGAGDRFREMSQRASEDFPGDYRPRWFRGEFFADAGRSVEAVAEYQSFLGSVQALDQVVPSALWDYAKAAYLATMVRTSAVVCQKFAQRTGQDLAQVPLYGIVSERLVTTDPGATYAAPDLWSVDAPGETQTVYSQVLGFRARVPGSWKLGFGGYSQGRAALTAQPPAIVSSQGKAITIHVVATFSTVAASLGDLMATNLRSLGSDYTVAAPVPRHLGSTDFLVSRVTNSHLYPDRGGMAGYAVFVACPYSETAGYNLDQPRRPPAGSGTSYFQVQARQDRVPAPVYEMILVDSCQEIAAETDQLFFDFLAGLEIR
jgi:hypothetical protein